MGATRRVLCRLKRDKGLGAAKYLYLTDKQIAYQLISSPENGSIDDKLDTFYVQLQALSSDRSSAIMMYLSVFALCFMSRFNLVFNIEAGGISLLPNALNHALLGLYAFAMLRLGLATVKHSYLASMFDLKFYKSNPERRALLLAKYPSAFDALKYYQTQIGCLPYTARMYQSKRMIAMLILLIAGLLIYIVLSGWVFISLATDVWKSSAPLSSWWSKSLVIGSTMVVLASWFLPYELFLKKSYIHVGLVKMLNAAHANDRPRYDRYFRKLFAIRQKTDGALGATQGSGDAAEHPNPSAASRVGPDG